MPLAIVVAHRNHRFAAVAEFAQRFADILHGRLIGSGEVLQVEHDAGNVAVIFCLPDCIDDIEQGVFLQSIAACAKQLAANHPESVAG
ncbi:hypothetical protein D3C75_349190 [compost metagenome]